MKRFTQHMKYAVLVPMAVAGSAYAAVPETVKTAIEGAKTDGLEAGWIVVGVVAALFVIAIVKRMIK